VTRRGAWSLAVAIALAATGCGGGDDGPAKPKTVQDAVTLGVLAAAKKQTSGTSQLRSEFCDLADVTPADVRKHPQGEPPLRFECTLTFGLINDFTTTYSVDYRTTLDARGCFSAVVKPGSKEVQGSNTFDAFGEPGILTGCVELPKE
jgi:hypothetical protein